jgi:repressor of nif and glnA expression
MQSTIEKKRLAILRVLHEYNNEAIGSNVITEKLTEMGYDISERTVRFHLLSMDKAGYTEYLPKRGRRITQKGIAEMSRARVYEKVGFLSTKIDRMTYRMNFDPSKRDGTVVINTSLIEIKYLKKACPLMCKILRSGLGMGKLLTFFLPGEELEQLTVPEGYIGIGTVCSITINGILLAQGIPTRSRFGGLLEIEHGKPSRFVALINYDGTSLDPLEIFMKSGMTDYTGAVENGSGLIGASFREMPAESRDTVVEIAEKLTTIGLGGFMEIGYPGNPLCEIPVTEGSFGSVIVGGLNTVGIIEESGIEVFSKALSGLVDFKRLFSFEEIEERVNSILKS